MQYATAFAVAFGMCTVVSRIAAAKLQQRYMARIALGKARCE